MVALAVLRIIAADDARGQMGGRSPCPCPGSGGCTRWHPRAPCCAPGSRGTAQWMGRGFDRGLSNLHGFVACSAIQVDLGVAARAADCICEVFQGRMEVTMCHSRFSEFSEIFSRGGKVIVFEVVDRFSRIALSEGKVPREHATRFLVSWIRFSTPTSLLVNGSRPRRQGRSTPSHLRAT